MAFAMKILMLAPQPFFEPRGTPLSVLGRLKALSELGHKVDLVTYHVGQNVAIPHVVIFRTPKIGIIRTISVGPSAKKLLLDMFVMAKAIRMLWKERYDLLHTHEEASFFGILLAKFFSVPHLYDMHSSLPQQLSNFRYSRFRPLLVLFQWLEQRVINSSDAVITICPALEAYARKINAQIPHVMIENVATDVDQGCIREEDVQKFSFAHGLDGGKIVVYAGTLEPYQGIDLLIESARIVAAQRLDVIFLLMGGKPEQIQHYKEKVDRIGLSKFFRFTGIRPPNEVRIAVRLSDILVSPRTSGTNTPLKIYSYLRAGKPIVATNLYTHTQVLNEEVSVLVEPEPTALAEGILSVLNDPASAKQMGRRAGEFFEHRYSFERFLQKTRAILESTAPG
jgi:glycosyltransferase involved in cell wall biosynthesis